MENESTKSQSMEYIITWNQIQKVAEDLIQKNILSKNTKVWGVPRGGQYLMAFFTPAKSPEDADVIIDDLIDSGSTFNQWQKKYPNKRFVAFFEKPFGDKRWYIFPWEKKDEPLKDNIVRICQFYGLKNVESIEELITEYENR